MTKLIYTAKVESKLDKLWGHDSKSAALIEELLLQLEEWPEILYELCKESLYIDNNPSFQIKRFKYLWNKGYTVYILKVWPTYGEAIKYRILYAHDPQKDFYYILDLMQRDINYEADSSLIKNIIDEYERADIPRYI